MKPIQEITLFESARLMDDVTTLIHSGDQIEVSIPQGGMMVDDRLMIKAAVKDLLIARTINIGNYCLGRESIPVFLRLRNGGTIIVSRLVKLFIKEDEVHLRDFRLLKQEWKERSEQRVQPKAPVYFTFTRGGQEIRASLHDISSKGMCIIANVPIQNIPEDISSSDVNLSISMQPFLEEFEVRGIVKNVRSLTDSLTRIGLEIFPTRSDFVQLGKYIHARREEIMEDIYCNFRELLNFRQVPDLRF